MDLEDDVLYLRLRAVAKARAGSKEFHVYVKEKGLQCQEYILWLTSGIFRARTPL